MRLAAKQQDCSPTPAIELSLADGYSFSAKSWEATLRVGNLVLAFVMLLTLAGCGINNIPTYEEQMKAKWSDVLNQYQRRADLIPNLVETVKGYAQQEKDVLTSVVEARAKATQMQIPPDILTNPDAFKQFQENQSQLSGALGRLLAIVENYPDLKSNQNFLALQSQLEGTENRIAVARRDYIGAVQVYNTELRTIPGRWWASLMYPDAKLAQTFTVEDKVLTVPKVDFNQTTTGGGSNTNP
jgi:LemA protein